MYITGIYYYPSHAIGLKDNIFNLQLYKVYLRYIDTVFLGRQNHNNQINAKFEKNLVHYIEFGCLLSNG